MNLFRRRSVVLAALASLALGGCATSTPDAPGAATTGVTSAAE